MVGLNFAGGFLIPDNWWGATVRSVVEHMRHIKDVAGAEAIGWGSDFDGIGGRLQWKDASGMQMLVDALSPYFTDDELDKICYKNFIRVLKDNETAAGDLPPIAKAEEWSGATKL